MQVFTFVCKHECTACLLAGPGTFISAHLAAVAERLGSQAAPPSGGRGRRRQVACGQSQGTEVNGHVRGRNTQQGGRANEHALGAERQMLFCSCASAPAWGGSLQLTRDERGGGRPARPRRLPPCCHVGVVEKLALAKGVGRAVQRAAAAPLGAEGEGVAAGAASAAGAAVAHWPSVTRQGSGEAASGCGWQ